VLSVEKTGGWNDLSPVSTTVSRAHVVEAMAEEPEDEPQPRRSTRHLFPWPRSNNHDNIQQPPDLHTVEAQSSLPLPLSNDDKLAISVLIAMPDATRPSYAPQFLSLPKHDDTTEPSFSILSDDGAFSFIGSVAQGKLRNSSIITPSQRPAPEEEELPDIVFGVAEVDWTSLPGSSSSRLGA